MIFLIRHAMVDAHGRFLPGRMPGIHLNEEGRRQANALSTALRRTPLTAVYSGPLERARETAEALADRPGHMTIVDELNEIDFGAWTGMPYDELDRQYEWNAFMRHRARSPIPGGEWMLNVQMRAWRAIGRLHRAHHGAAIAVVSHLDVLRSIIARAMDVPLDRLDSFRIHPASVSTLEWTSAGFEIGQINNCSYSESPAPSPSRGTAQLAATQN